MRTDRKKESLQQQGRQTATITRDDEPDKKKPQETDSVSWAFR